VEIMRPLLGFTKEELVAVCRDASVRWVEDGTNEDRTYTLRNTVRYLLKTGVLPMALRTGRLLKLAENVAEREMRVETLAQGHFERMDVRLDVRLGRAAFIVRDDRLVREAGFHVRAVILRKLMALVAPQDVPSLRDLRQTVETVFASCPLSGTVPRFNVAGISMRAERDTRDNIVYTIQRSTPTSHEHEKRRLEMPLLPRDASDKASDWHLWDGRYWLRVWSLDTSHTSKRVVVVRFMKPDDLAAARQSLLETERKRLNRHLASAPNGLPFTLPAIFELGDHMTAGERLVALPSLGWSRDTGERRDGESCFWEVRYKKVEFECSTLHTMEGYGS